MYVKQTDLMVFHFFLLLFFTIIFSCILIPVESNLYAAIGMFKTVLLLTQRGWKMLLLYNVTVLFCLQSLLFRISMMFQMQ